MDLLGDTTWHNPVDNFWQLTAANLCSKNKSPWHRCDRELDEEGEEEEEEEEGGRKKKRRIAKRERKNGTTSRNSHNTSPSSSISPNPLQFFDDELFECRCPQKNPQLIYFYYYIYLNNNEQKGYSSPPSPSSRAPLQILPRQGCWRQCCRLGSATLQRAPSASSGLICYVISSSSFSFSSPFFPLLPSALHF